MNDIAFHFNVQDRLTYVCRLLRKAVASGSRLVVTGALDDLAAIDASLWALSATDFVTHCMADASASVAAASAVVLSEDCLALGVRPVLVNLGSHVPAGFAQFDRLVEVVSQDETDRQLARARWRYYLQMGCHLTQFDLSKAKS